MCEWAGAFDLPGEREAPPPNSGRFTRGYTGYADGAEARREHRDDSTERTAVLAAFTETLTGMLRSYCNERRGEEGETQMTDTPEITEPDDVLLAEGVEIFAESVAEAQVPTALLLLILSWSFLG